MECCNPLGSNTVRGRLASTGIVKPWLHAQVVEHLVNHSALFYTPTTTWPSPRNFGYAREVPAGKPARGGSVGIANLGWSRVVPSRTG